MTQIAQNALAERIRACTLCAGRFAATHTAHAPRPVVWFRPSARLVIAGQAPGMRVHKSGRPFDDPSGDRLREWLGLSRSEFYDKSRVAIVPMAFCFPGYDARGADLPPPRTCRDTWHKTVMQTFHSKRFSVIVGGYAQKYHLGARTGVTDTVRAWRDHWPDAVPVPHPSWRNTAWLKKNPWFEAEVLPELRKQVQRVMNG